MNRLILIFCLFATGVSAQEGAFHILLGSPIGMLGEGRVGLKPKPGFAIGLDYWVVNKKGNVWSVGASWGSFRRKQDRQKETFEYLTVRGMPLVWLLDKKKAWHIELGGFANYLLHQEYQDVGAVTNDTKLIQRTYLGICGGFGVHLGEKDKNRILLGLRDDYGLLGLGKGTPLKFNTLTLFAGLEF